LYSNSHERAAVQLINDNNRTGGADVTTTMQKKIDELTAKLAQFATPPTGDQSGLNKSTPGDQSAAAKHTG